MVRSSRKSWAVPLGLGLAAGAVLAVVDNVLFEGEVSPIVIVGLLLAVSVTAGAAWGGQGRLAVMSAWAWLPGAHLVKRVLGLPDTLHPNTYASILMLAAFSLAVAMAGLGCGLLIRRLTSGTYKPAERS